MKKVKYSAALIAAALMAGVSAQAVEFSAASGAFSDTTSWTGGVLPSSTEPAEFATSNQTMNVDGDYTVTSVGNPGSAGSGNEVGGAGTLTVTAGNVNNALGISNAATNNNGLLQITGNVTINNSTANANTYIQATSGNVIEFTPSSTLTLTTKGRLNGSGNGVVQLNGVVVGDADMPINHDIASFNAGHDSSAWGGNIIMNGSGRNLAINGGIVGNSATELIGNFGDNTIALNGTNVINGANIKTFTANMTLDVNAGQTNMGAILQMNGGSTLTINIEDLGEGEEVWFADSSGSAGGWNGSLDVVGFSTNTIRFGSTSGGLTASQLDAITTDGAGGAELDANGYLFFAGPPPVNTGVTIVDYQAGSDTNARPADIQTDTGYTWNFSETEPLFNDPAGQNRTIYGGAITTWSVSTNYVPEVELLNNQIITRVNPLNSSATAMKGMHVWSKEDFLSGSNGTLSFTNGNAMSFVIQFQWGGGLSRFVVKQGGIYYASDASAASGGLEIDPSDPAVEWGIISTNDYSIGTPSQRTFTNVQAVGIAYEFSKGAAAPSGCNLTFNDFQVRAIVDLPPPTEISEVSSTLVGGQMILSWQGTNTAVYGLQMKTDLVFDTEWSNVVINIAGTNDIMSVTNATDAPQAFFRTILEN